MATILPQTQESIQEVNNSVETFLSKFHVGDLLRKCRAHKTKGFEVTAIFSYLLGCMFSPISTYMAMRTGKYQEDFSKNTIYRFCNEPSHGN